jgi:hypothetical protein
MSQAGVAGDIRDPGIQDAVARWWFTHYHSLFEGNWLLVAAAWHMGARAVTDRIVEPSGLAAAEVDLVTIERLVPGESVYVSRVMDGAALMVPRMHPDAIDVTDQVPLPGKPWSGGSGNRKLVFHTIEGGDPDEIGWPRDWTLDRSAASGFELGSVARPRLALSDATSGCGWVRVAGQRRGGRPVRVASRNRRAGRQRSDVSGLVLPSARRAV